MRVLFHTNAPFTFTGYGGQVRQIIPRMTEMGHQVGVVCNFGVAGSTLSWNGIPLYPLRIKQHNAEVVHDYVRHFGADIVISLYDIWALPPDQRERYGVPWVAMVPVDGSPVAQPSIVRLKDVDYVVTYSQFAKREIEKVGFRSDFIPHGLDVSVFSPGDRAASREKLGFPQDAFVVTVVAANKGFPPRKSWPEILAAFARFHERHSDTLLYCHTTKVPYGSGNEGIFFDDLREAIGLRKGALAFPDQGSLAIGVPDEEMVDVYSASNVLLSPSMGEGFGLPILEAQACGCPVITQECSAMDEITHWGWAIEPLQPMWMSILRYFWQIASIDRIDEALDAIYCGDFDRGTDAEECVQWVRDNYAYDVVWETYWVPFLEMVEQTLW